MPSRGVTPPNLAMPKQGPALLSLAPPKLDLAWPLNAFANRYVPLLYPYNTSKHTTVQCHAHTPPSKTIRFDTNTPPGGNSPYRCHTSSFVAEPQPYRSLPCPHNALPKLTELCPYSTMQSQPCQHITLLRLTQPPHYFDMLFFSLPSHFLTVRDPAVTNDTIRSNTAPHHNTTPRHYAITTHHVTILHHYAALPNVTLPCHHTVTATASPKLSGSRVSISS